MRPRIDLQRLDRSAMDLLARSPEEFEARYRLRLGEERDLAVQASRQTDEGIVRPGVDPRWWGYLGVEASTRQVIGTCAFKGAPDGGGAVEIAYFTFPRHEGKGHGSAMARELVAIAFASGVARMVVAHTTAEENASVRILRRLGFCFRGAVPDPEIGTAWRWERAVPPPVTLARQPARTFFGIRRRVRPPEMGMALAEILPRTHAQLASLGIGPGGPPATLYLGHDEERGLFDIVGGFFIEAGAARDAASSGPAGTGPAASGATGSGATPSGAASPEPFSRETIPAGDVATTIHPGPYEGLGDTHSLVRAWIDARGRRPAGPCWETYLTDPSLTPDAGDYRTEVAWLVEGGRGAR
jgi:RimJ/RimL family protein N-acetyltransferase